MLRRSFLSLLPVAAVGITSIPSLLRAKEPVRIGVDVGMGQSWSYAMVDLVAAGHSPAEVVKYTPAQLLEFRRRLTRQVLQ